MTDFIIHEPTPKEPFVIINKPQNLPSAPIKSDDDCALNRVIELYPQIKMVKGKKEIEYGLVHRLDTVTGGLLMIAVTQEFYDRILLLQQEGKFIKEYTAYCDEISDITTRIPGYPEFDNRIEFDINGNAQYTVQSTFRPYGPGRKEVRPVLENANKAAQKKSGTVLYSTKISIQKKEDIKAVCTITAGYRHQVRSHLAWSGFPIINDSLYNPNAKLNPIKFFATGIEFDGFKFKQED